MHNKKSMKKRFLLISVSLLSFLGISVSLISRGTLSRLVQGDINPYLLDMNRSITSSEITDGEAIFNTNNGNPITFKFDANKSSTGNGLINIQTDGYFYNDTPISGITNINVTLSGGSATLTYGNGKNNLNAGSETLNTNGDNNVPFNVILDSPSNYIRLDVGTGPSLLNRLKITYSCINEAKTPITILYQGDSITDNSRSRTNLDDLGGGYAQMVSQRLEQVYGNQYDFTFINRAHSGWNLIDDWNAGGVNHYEEEFYQYNADIATILIGYNDIIDHANDGGVSDEDYESCYRELLQGLVSRGTKPVCLAPFDINAATTEYRTREFTAKKQIVQDLAEEFNAEFIDMGPYMHQAVTDGAYRMELFGDWTHPWAAGCRIIEDLVFDKIAHLIDDDYVTPSNLGAYNPLVPTTSDNVEDYTNYRAFFASSFGKMEYDYTTYSSSADFVSTKSLKATHPNPDPVNVNAYLKVLFDFSDDGMKDLSSGTMYVDIKIDNLMPRISFKAHSGLLRSTYDTDMTSEYSVSLSDPSKVEQINDGWYRITINLNAWATEDTNHVLNNAIAISVISSKGESDSSRSTYGIDGKKDSYIWIDNLRFDLQGGEQDYHAAKESFAAGVSYAKQVVQKDYNKVSFEYQITNDGTMGVVVVDPDDWNVGYGSFMFDKDGPTSTYTNLEYEAIEDGWISVSILLNKNTKLLSTLPTKVSLFRISGTRTTANGFIDHISFSKVFIPRGAAFTGGTDYTINPPDIALTETIIIDFKFTSENGTYINFMLGDWSNYYGYYKITAEGSLGENYDGISLTYLSDGYFRVTIVLSELTKVNGTPTTISLFRIRGKSSTASGYCDFNPNEEPEVSRGSAFYASTSFSQDISPALSLTDTFVVDIKFTTGSSTYATILLREGWGDYYGFYKIFANGTLASAYNGVTIQLLEDGYYRVTFNIAQLDIGSNFENITQIDLFHMSGSRTTADGYIDLNPTI